MHKNIFILIIGSLFAFSAQATFLDLNTLYYSDQFATATDNSISHSAWDLGVGYEIGNSKRFAIALSFGGVSQSEKFTTTTKFTNSDTGLKIFYMITRSKTVSTTITYNFISKAKYDNGTSEVELRGTSIKADLAYNFWLGDYSALALKIYYYKPSFIESVANSAITDVSYNRTTISPGFGITYLF